MAVRLEKVVLELEDRFTNPMIRAAAATQLLDKNLSSLSGSAVRSDRDVAKTDKTIRSVGDSSDRSGKQIDRLSGRLSLLAQATSVLGPALIPLGAPLVGVMAGLTAQLGAVAGSVGVAVLAFKGMGDGLKAVNAYQLEPTAENLQAMRVEMEKLGPSGAEFVRFLDSLGPELSSLQMAAREGLLPGVTAGIEEMVTMLPRVRSIVSNLAEAMGGLAANAGADLAGPEWRRFFRYLDNEAGPLLTEFGNTVGNFANGFANMIVSLSPLTEDFSGGLLDMSESFAQWSTTLDSNQGFQEFLDYVQDAGPKALDFLGSLVDALASIATAAAPVGNAVLPVLTKLLDIVADLADSPLGPMFFTAAAAMSVYSRGAAVAAAATTKLGAAQSYFARTNAAAMGGLKGIKGFAGPAAASLGMVALAYTDVDDRAGLSNTAMLGLAGTWLGPWGTAAGVAVGLTMDLVASNDDLAAAIDRANEASANGTVKQQETEYANLRAQVDETNRAIDEMWSGRDKTGESIWQQIGGDISTTFKGVGAVLTGASADGANALAILEANMGSTNFVANQMADILGVTARQFEVASGNAQAFSGALAQMAGWLDQRAALRAYQEELKNFGKALENGFQPKNVEGLDRVANGILQVATQIKNVDVRRDFMANARESLLEFAGTGPKAEAAVRRVLDQFVKLGLMEPVVEVDADTKGADGKLDRTRGKARDLDNFKVAPGVDAETGDADRKLTATQRLARELAGLPINPRVRVESSAADAAIAAIKRHLLDLDGTTATTFIRVQRLGDSGMGPTRVGNGEAAEGGFVPKTGRPYADRHHYLLADGEGVTTNRHGETDRFRDVIGGINAGFSRWQIKGMLAGGGVVGAYSTSQRMLQQAAGSAGRSVAYGASSANAAPRGPLRIEGHLDIETGFLRGVVVDEVDARIGDYRAHDSARAGTIYGGVGSD